MYSMGELPEFIIGELANRKELSGSHCEAELVEQRQTIFVKSTMVVEVSLHFEGRRLSCCCVIGNAFIVDVTSGTILFYQNNSLLLSSNRRIIGVQANVVTQFGSRRVRLPHGIDQDIQSSTTRARRAKTCANRAK